MIKVNLVPAEILAKARQRQMMLQGAVVGSIVVCIVLMVSAWHWYGLYQLKNEFAFKEAELRRLDAIVKQVEELEKASAAVRARLGVIEELLKGRAYYPVFMSDFAATVPAGVKVMSLNTTMAPGSQLKLAIGAQGRGSDDVATWVRTLEGNPKFSNVELGPVGAGGTGYSFTIVTTYTNKL